MIRKVILYSLLLLISCSVFSQSYQFYHLSSEHGLPTNYITSITEDTKSFIWFGTQDGLCRYDGYNMTVFKKKAGNENSLSSSDIKCIYFHPNNNKLYIGTKEGFNICDPLFNTIERVKLSEGKTSGAELSVNCIIPLNEETLIIGSKGGLYFFNVASKKARLAKLPVSVDVLSLYSRDGTVFIGTDGEGIWILTSDGKLKSLEITVPSDRSVQGEGSRHVNAIGFYEGSIYAGTNGSGLLKINGKTFRLEEQYTFAEDKFNSNFIKSFSIDNGLCYIGTRGGFISLQLSNGAFQLFTKSEHDRYGLSDDIVNAVFIDRQQNIWLGTFGGGVSYITSQSKRFPALPRIIANEFLQTFSIYEDAQKNLWIGGEQSFKMLNRKAKTVTDHSEVIGANYVLSITGDKEGDLWLGTWGVGLIKYSPKSKISQSFLTDSVGGTVLDLYYDKKENNLWIGTFGDGLFVLHKNDNRIDRYTEKNGLSSNNITKIFRDSDNNIWLATSGGGVCFIKDGNINNSPVKVFKHAEKANSISSNDIYSISEDREKNIWISTNLGLNKYDRKSETFSSFYEDHGLMNEFLYCALPDNDGNIWVSTNVGLTKFDPENKSGISFTNFDKSDGLLVAEHTQGAYLKMSTGELVFGGSTGIDIIDPAKVNTFTHPPPVFLLGYKRNGKDVVTDTTIAYKKHLKLNWRENYLQFEFGALFQTPSHDYRAQNNNKFKYILEGYDKEWSEPSNIRYVSYTELPGGNYTFKVTAANNDGIWNPEPFYIHITVVPPFWKTLWFYILVSGVGLAAIILFTQYRTRAIKKENRILENKVAERTRELAEKNRDITSSIQYAKRIQEAILPTKQHFHNAFKNAFILYKPKDIVSGDFYWFGVKNGQKIFAVVDCTGHGVPGAFMSMIGYNLLNQIILEKGITEPADILNNLHNGVQNALKQGSNEVNTNDGMDVSMISVNELTGAITWAGAFRPVVIVRADGQVEKIDGNKFPVGGAQLDYARKFLSQQIKMEHNDTLYMFSDGYADQFGGEKGKKFMVKRFHDLLCEIHRQDMAEQQAELEKRLEQWRGGLEQVDDVLVAGIRF